MGLLSLTGRAYWTSTTWFSSEPYDRRVLVYGATTCIELESVDYMYSIIHPCTYVDFLHCLRILWSLLPKINQMKELV